MSFARRACQILALFSIVGNPVAAEVEGQGMKLPAAMKLHEREDLSAEGTGSDYAKQFVNFRYPPTISHRPIFDRRPVSVREHHPAGPGYGGTHFQWTPFEPFHRPHLERPIDPYVLFLFSRYSRFLPRGLGLYGIYGSSGLPKPKPPGIFGFSDKE